MKVRLASPAREEVIALQIPKGKTLDAEAAVMQHQFQRLPAALESAPGRPVAIVREAEGYVLRLHDQDIPLWLPQPTRNEAGEPTTVEIVETTETAEA
ncbi:MAG: hypothetical protein AAGF11_21005 [Myxococcota bacterium]